jgi:hypothetical protein
MKVSEYLRGEGIPMDFSITTRWAACLLLLFSAAGCTTYYRVTDQSSKRTYYTTDYDRAEGGAIRFEDERTGATVTLQSSEIVEITRQEFEGQSRK